MKRFLQCTAALLMLGSSVGCCYVGGVCDPCTGIMFGGKWEPICGGPLDPCGWRCGVGCGPVAPPCGPTCGPVCAPAPGPGPIVPPIHHGPDCGCHGHHGHHGHHGPIGPGPGNWHPAPGGPVHAPAPAAAPTVPAPVPEPMSYYDSAVPTQTAAISGTAPLLTIPAGLYGSHDSTTQSTVHPAGAPVQH